MPSTTLRSRLLAGSAVLVMVGAAILLLLAADVPSRAESESSRVCEYTDTYSSETHAAIHLGSTGCGSAALTASGEIKNGSRFLYYGLRASTPATVTLCDTIGDLSLKIWGYEGCNDGSRMFDGVWYDNGGSTATPACSSEFTMSPGQDYYVKVADESFRRNVKRDGAFQMIVTPKCLPPSPPSPAPAPPPAPSSPPASSGPECLWPENGGLKPSYLGTIGCDRDEVVTSGALVQGQILVYSFLAKEAMTLKVDYCERDFESGYYFGYIGCDDSIEFMHSVKWEPCAHEWPVEPGKDYFVKLRATAEGSFKLVLTPKCA